MQQQFPKSKKKEDIVLIKTKNGYINKNDIPHVVSDSYSRKLRVSICSFAIIVVILFITLYFLQCKEQKKYVESMYKNGMKGLTKHYDDLYMSAAKIL